MQLEKKNNDPETAMILGQNVLVSVKYLGVTVDDLLKFDVQVLTDCPTLYINALCQRTPRP